MEHLHLVVRATVLQCSPLSSLPLTQPVRACVRSRRGGFLTLKREGSFGNATVPAVTTIGELLHKQTETT